MKQHTNTVLWVLIICLILVNVFVYSKIITSTIPEPHYALPTPENQQNTESSDLHQVPDTLPAGYTYIQADLADTHAGPLMLVNTSHEFLFDNRSTLVPMGINESLYYNKTGSYSVKDINVTFNVEATKALNDMMDDFYAYMGNKKTLIVTEGYRTAEKQQEMLDRNIQKHGENQTFAQKPGFSEHHTGYAFDINLYENGTMGNFTGEDKYAWIFENAHKYGFVLRYPQGKEDITGISYEAWHFRYVGVPHATYMFENKLTLEEYLDTLAMYPFNSAKLSVTDPVNGKAYQIYSVDVPSDGTQIPVPTGADGGVYALSGDNNGHIIVTEEVQTTP